MKLSGKLPLGCALAFVYSFLVVQASGQIPGPIANRVTQAPDNSHRITLTGNVHPLARAEFSQGPAADSLPMDRMLLLLKRSDAQETALQALLESQQDKASPNYRRWLDPEEFGRQFGPSDSDIQAAADWLTAQGFHDIRVAAGRAVIEFSGNAGQVRQAFATQIQNYAVKGKVYDGNSSDPQIPAALAPVISGIVSLHNFPRRSFSRYLGDARRNRGNGALQPLFTFPSPFGGGGNFYGLGPGDFAAIYGSGTLLSNGTDGSGQTIAIVGETQINPSDVGDFRTMFGLTRNFPATNIIVNGMDPGITSRDEESEADLDVQWSGAVAPGATVKLVVSASTPASSGVDLSALYIVEHNLADIMSESYGECEKNLGAAGNAFFNSLWEQAAAQGITVVVSSGDGGSAGCDDFSTSAPATHGLAVNGLSGTPFNVSVGGTDFNQINVWSSYWNTINDTATGTSAKGYIPELPWNENCAQLGLTGCGSSAPQGSVNIVAGGGGPSSTYAKPKFQVGVAGVPNDNHRDQPDLSLFASPGFTGSGYVFCQKDLTSIATCTLDSGGYTFHIIGGTSASAPAFAGVMALVNQYAAAHGGTSRQGNANVTLYALSKQSGASCASSATEGPNCIFNDIVAGNTYLATRYGKSVGTNSVPCKGSTLNCSSSVASTNGVLVDPSHTTTEAWTAAAGYDLATGLGTVNVSNLATKWTSASTIATTTTLTLTPTTGITHGTSENVSVSINVKPNTGSGIPGGDVALMAMLADGSTLGVDGFTLSNGAVTSVKTQSLPGGTYKVYAHYAGDGTNAPSDSAQVQVTVGKESSQTFIVIPTFDSQGKQTSGNANSLVYGSNYIIRMYVTNGSSTASATGPPSPTCEKVNDTTCPTGTVTLTANGSAVDRGTFALNNNGYTRDLAPTLTGGTYSLVANYPGDSSYTASTSATDTLTITPAPTSINVYPTVVHPTVGIAFDVNVSGTPDVPLGTAPTGTISLFDGTSLVAGPVAVQNTGGWNGNPGISATLPVTFAAAGDHTLTAKYSGDASYAATTSSPVVVHSLYGTTVNVSLSSASVSYGQSVTVTATVTTNGQSPAMTGTLTFYGSYTNIPGPVTSTLTTDASGNQTLTAKVTTTPQFNEYVQVHYSGDGSYADNYSPAAFVVVNIPDFTLGPPSVSIVPMAGQPASAQITITPVTQTPSTVSLSLTQPIIIAGYDLSLNPAQVGLNGSAATATLSLTPTAAISPAIIRNTSWQGAILFPAWDDWWSLGCAAGILALLLLTWPDQHRRFRLAYAPALICVLAFTIGCGGGGATGTSGSGNPGGGVVTPPGPTSITLASTNARSPWGQGFTITATGTSSKPLTGSISFYDFGNLIASFANTNGQAQIGWGYITQLGAHQITATYDGDAHNLASTSQPLTQVITGTTTVSIAGATGGDTHYISATIGVQ